MQGTWTEGEEVKQELLPRDSTEAEDDMYRDETEMVEKEVLKHNIVVLQDAGISP